MRLGLRLRCVGCLGSLLARLSYAGLIFPASWRGSLTLGHAGCLVALVTVTSVCWVAACVGVTGAAMHTMTTKQAARIHCHIQLNMDLHSAVCTEIVSCRRKSFAF